MEHVWAEVINVRGESFTKTMKALNDDGYRPEANRLADVSTDKELWERYARDTFLAHAAEPRFAGKLRFLQYVTKDTEQWWKQHRQFGAVLL